MKPQITRIRRIKENYNYNSLDQLNPWLKIGD